jgi:hypothetical protein
MNANQNVFILLVLSLWAALCSATSMWRADTRDPDTIKAAGGFIPKAATFHIAPANTSMYNHAVGANDGSSMDNDGYVSTTSTQQVAIDFLSQQFGGTGYVYEVAASYNFISVAGTLLQFNPYPAELEYAALGGVSWNQVIRWTHYTNGVADSNGAQDNPDYQSSVYASLTPNEGDPQLAAFPVGHQAWGISPWNVFSSGPSGSGCGASNPPRLLRFLQSLRSRADTSKCTPRLPNDVVAQNFIELYCDVDNVCS